MNEDLLLAHLRNVPDYPIPGIQFQDVSTLFCHAPCVAEMRTALYEYYKDKGITKVVGIESRGFVMGAVLAADLGAGFVMARKPGKLQKRVALCMKRNMVWIVLKSIPTPLLRGI